MATKSHHRGIREFTGEELSSVALGQCGFMIINNATVETGSGGTAGFRDFAYFVALKAVDDDAELEARSVAKGDDLTLASGGVYTGSDPVTIGNGDLVYGAFDKVTVASGDYVLAYIGRNVT